MFKNQQKANTNHNTQSAELVGRELFGNWELKDELDDAELKAVAGGLVLHLGVGVTGAADANTDVEWPSV